jgi:hypothetical protein
VALFWYGEVSSLSDAVFVVVGIVDFSVAVFVVVGSVHFVRVIGCGCGQC